MNSRTAVEHLSATNKDTHAPSGLLIIRCQHGGSHGVVSMMAAAKLASPFSHLKSLNAVLVGDSVGSIEAAGLAIGMDPTTFPDLFETHVVDLLSKKDDVVLKALHTIFGKKRVCDVDIPLYITSANITEGVKPGGFLYLPQDFRDCHPELKLPANVNENTLLADAVSASIAVPIGRSPRTLPDGQRHMDLGMIEQHPPIHQILTQFRRHHPDTPTILLSMSNFIIEPESPQADMDLLWAIRKGPRLLNSYIQAQRREIDTLNYDHVIELGVRVPRGTSLPKSLSALPYDIKYITTVAREIMSGEEYQAQLDRVVEVLSMTYGLKNISDATSDQSMVPRAALPLPQYQPPGIRETFKAGTEFSLRATGAAAKGVGTFLVHTWKSSAAARQHAAESLLGTLLPPPVPKEGVQGWHPQKAESLGFFPQEPTPPLLPHSSEQHRPSGYEHKLP